MTAEAPKKLRLKTSLTVAAVSAVLGPLLDNYHSQFHVLSYNNPVEFQWYLLGQPVHFVTAPFTTPLFVVAGLIIGLGTLRINEAYGENDPVPFPSAMATIAAFAAVYYLSAALPGTPAAPVTGPLLVHLAALEWYALDRSVGGLVMGALTAVGGPVVEVALINVGHLYTYSSPEFLGIPFFIVPVYFAGGPAVGNLARALYVVEREGTEHENKNVT